MNIHEYQTKKLLYRYSIPIQDFRVVQQLEDVSDALEEMEITEGVVKIQVHAGGRGKAGGVKIGKSPQEIQEHVKALLGKTFITPQTGPEGVVCHEVMIAELADIEKEYYLGLIVDREKATPLLIASPEGGMEIEEISVSHPEKICKEPISLKGEIAPSRLDYIAEFMQWEGATAEEGKALIVNLCKAFVENDGSILEINPLIEDPQGHLWALDAKFVIDDNALFRHPKIATFYDSTQESEAEAIAHEMDLAYIALDGNIGCMVNGAGLAMATMDLIQYHGGSPANFLDVGGSANKEKVAKSFAIILSDPSVKAILVNIFGGIMRCDVIAQGVIAAAEELQIDVPLVVRLEGTNVEEGKALLEESTLDIIAAEHLADAAKKAVEAARGHTGTS